MGNAVPLCPIGCVMPYFGMLYHYIFIQENQTIALKRKLCHIALKEGLRIIIFKVNMLEIYNISII